MNHSLDEGRFRVLTYNILANAYAKPERYPHSSSDDLEPTARRRRLLDQIAAIDADVMCLQEVERDAFDDIQARIGPSFTGLFEARPDHPDGSAIFVRHGAFELAESVPLHYQSRERGDAQLALVAFLRRRDRVLAIASTHLRWQSQETPRERHLGRLQLLELLALRQARTADDTAWIIAGDLNALSESVVIQAALERGLELSCRSQRPWDTVNIGGRRRKIDYLLYEPPKLEAHPGTLPRLERDTPMPSSVHPSDHLPLEVTFAFKR
jgi:mRNA deadenylase 3'-5' endonuclease subunit Ccr4